MSDNLTLAEWRPVGWTPVVYAGTPWFFGARLEGAKAGAVNGGALFVNGVEFPVEANADRVTFTVSAEAVARIPNHAPCSLYLDLAGQGRVLWLTGTVTARNSPHDNA